MTLNLLLVSTALSSPFQLYKMLTVSWRSDLLADSLQDHSASSGGLQHREEGINDPVPRADCKKSHQNARRKENTHNLLQLSQ